MSDSTSALVKDFEELVRKTAEANKVFISEGSKFVRKLGTSPKGMAGIQPDLLKDAFNSFMKLNMQHANNLIDLGLTLTKRFNSSPETTNESFEGPAASRDEIPKPAFVLKAGVVPGHTAKVQFILDSDKKEPVLCKLVHTDFVHQNDFSEKPAFKTTILPQSFQLNPSESQTVDIHVKVPANAKAGVYLSHLQVQGFEHTFFSLYITVSEKQTSPL